MGGGLATFSTPYVPALMISFVRTLRLSRADGANAIPGIMWPANTITQGGGSALPPMSKILHEPSAKAKVDAKMIVQGNFEPVTIAVYKSIGLWDLRCQTSCSGLESSCWATSVQGEATIGSPPTATIAHSWGGLEESYRVKPRLSSSWNMWSEDRK
jgi:hypothetical protein